MAINHKINNEVQFSIDQKKHEKRKREFQPKFQYQRLKGFYYIGLTIGFILQSISCLLASTGAMHFISSMLNSNGFIIIVGAACCLAGLEFAYRKTLKIYNAQKLDDETDIAKVTYAALIGLGLLYVGSSYYGSEHAVTFFAAAPNVHDLEQIAIEQDIKIKTDSSFWASRVAVAQLSADTFLSTNGKKDRFTGIWRIRSGSAKGLEKKLAKVDKLGASLTIAMFKAKDRKTVVLDSLNAENQIILADHKDFCSSFGNVMAWISVFCVLLFIPIFNWCEDFKRKETLENEVILSKYLSVDQHTPEVVQEVVIEQEVKEEGEGEDNPKVIDTEDSNPLQFKYAASKEGDIIKGEGRKHDRIVGKVGGEMRELLLGDLNRLIKGNKDVKDSLVIPYYNELKKKLEAHKK